MILSLLVWYFLQVSMFSVVFLFLVKQNRASLFLVQHCFGPNHFFLFLVWYVLQISLFLVVSLFLVIQNQASLFLVQHCFGPNHFFLFLAWYVHQISLCLVVSLFLVIQSQASLFWIQHCFGPNHVSLSFRGRSLFLPCFSGFSEMLISKILTVERWWWWWIVLQNDWLTKNFKPYFQLGPLSGVFTILNLWYVSRIWTSEE